MRLPTTEHIRRPWRIHEIAPDFEVEDVWALPTPGGPDDLPRLIAQITSGGDWPDNAPLPVRFVWEARWKIGTVLRLDRKRDEVGSRVASLRDRLPADLAVVPRGPDFPTLPFTPVYELPDEWAAEMANRTVHTIMHIGWVADADADGGHRGQMAVLVKPNGRFGAAYMQLIKPFRYWLVYPALMKVIGRGWAAGRAASAEALA
ncbi:DUF2867 domain-containing protein [Luteipulveratus halotolerans]|uniref:DUF2867 domain-containing protein n=1 Tax=Luteipulveratus halotolerans TaxID=1631356 RepID=A0A0L6CMR2_9MICO|nr:DUF2867 domain-containing protein [Luteipulveratus halotolerans]KNX39002.1 hypothetical protein VV01_20710 [Luteipulveratus halotolerans]